GCAHHRVHLIAPVFRGLVTLRFQRLVGIALAAEVVGHHVEFLGEIAAGDLLDPRQMALREAVDEEDFGPIRIAPVLRRNGEAVGRFHRDRLERLLAWADVLLNSSSRGAYSARGEAMGSWRAKAPRQSHLLHATSMVSRLSSASR